MNARTDARARRMMEAIRDDHRSGSLALTKRAARVLLRLVERSPASVRELRGHLARACRMLAAAQPQMASILNLCNAALLAASRCGGPPDRARAEVREAVEGFLGELDSHTEAAVAAAAGLIGDGAVVMTHSYSSMVRDAVWAARARGVRLRVLVTESRPLREGVALARDLSSAGIPVTLGVDAMVGALVEEANLVLVGADAVCARGVVNKTGTWPAALAAREMNKACYALSVTEKFVPAGYELPAEEDKGAGEVMRLVPKGVQVRNRYFERTPLEWFTGVVTEEGVLRRGQLRRRLSRMGLHPALASAPKGR